LRKEYEIEALKIKYEYIKDENYNLKKKLTQANNDLIDKIEEC